MTSPFSKKVRPSHSALDHDEPMFLRAGATHGQPADAVLSTPRPLGVAPRHDEATRAGVARRMPTLSAATETARAFELRAGEPATVASALTSGGLARRTGSILRKAAAVTVAGLALVGFLAIFHSLGLAWPR